MPLQEKQEVLKQWVASGENLKVMETKLVISRSQEGTLTKGKEALTIKEMKQRGFSQKLALIRGIAFLILFCHVEKREST